MSSRRSRDFHEHRTFMPDNTMYLEQEGRDTYVFEKNTEVGIPFTIAVYFDPDENGYSASLVSPQIEEAWQNAHVGHIFKDGTICFGGTSPRTRQTLREAYAKSCLWAEGMAIMMASHLSGEPSEFPFSNNNRPDEVL